MLKLETLLFSHQPSTHLVIPQTMNADRSINRKRPIWTLYQNSVKDNKIQKNFNEEPLTPELKVETKENYGDSPIDNLPYELKMMCISFLKDDVYLLIAPVSKTFRNLYLELFSTTKTSCMAAISSVSCARYCMIQALETNNAIYWDYSCTFHDNENSHKIDWITQTVRRAVSEGKNEILYLADEFELRLNDIFDNEHQMELGKHGDTAILEFLKRKDLNISEYVALGAANGGRLDILEWMKENDYKMELDSSYGTLCYHAAKAGNLNVLQWAIEKGFEFSQVRMAGYHAVAGGHLDVLKWMKRNGYEIEMDKAYGSLCYQAAKNGHLHVLKWGRSEGFTLNKRICAEAAALSGDIQVLAFCKTEECCFNENTIFNAVSTGNLDAVKYCFDNDCPRNENLCMAAVKSGNVECLKLVRSYGVPWAANTCYDAARYGNLPMLKYAHENGCPLDKKTLDVAKYRFRFNSKGEDVVKYLEENNCLK